MNILKTTTYQRESEVSCQQCGKTHREKPHPVLHWNVLTSKPVKKLGVTSNKITGMPAAFVKVYGYSVSSIFTFTGTDRNVYVAIIQ